MARNQGPNPPLHQLLTRSNTKMKNIILFALAFTLNSKGWGQQLDQSNFINTDGGLGAEGINSIVQAAQTFTAGRTGFLTEVDLQVVILGDVSIVTDDLRITLSRVASLDTPIGVSLATVTVHPAGVPHLDQAGYSSSYVMPIHFSTPPLINQAEVFSLTLASTQPFNRNLFGQCDWIVTDAVDIDQYPLGAAWHNLSSSGWTKESHLQDFGFRTFVTPVPEPSTLCVSGGACAAWLWRARARRRAPICHPKNPASQNPKTPKRVS